MMKAHAAFLFVLSGAMAASALAGPAGGAEPDRVPVDGAGIHGVQDQAAAGELGPLAAAELAARRAVSVPGASRQAGPRPPAPVGSKLDQLAHRLGDDPRRIATWVRTHVTFEPGWGSVLGAEGCRQTLTCNAHDTTSLLIGLLEAAGYDARYVTGVVDLDASLFTSVVGDMDTVEVASRAATAAGWPHEVLPGGAKVRIAHVWAEAPLGYRRGYTPLDAALKPHQFLPPRTAPFDGSAFAARLMATVTYDPLDATVTDFDGAVFDTVIAAGSNAMTRRLAALRPGSRAFFSELNRITGTLKPATAGDRAASRVVTVTGRDEALPDAIRHRVSVGFPSAAGMPSADVFLDVLAGNRLTVDFGAADQAASDAVAAAGGVWAVAPRSILLRPQLLIGGASVLTGAPIPFTDFQSIEVRVVRPDGLVSSSATTFLRAGGVGSVVVDPVRVGSGTLAVVGDRIRALGKRLRSGAPTRVTFDELHGDVLLAHGLAYFASVDLATELAAHRYDVREVAAVPGIALVSWQPVVRAGAVPAGSLQIDVQQVGIAGGVARDGNPAAAALHRQAAGAFSSGMEHGVFGSMLGLRATSTVDLIRRALDADVPIGVIVDDASRDTVFGKLVAPANVRDFIANSVAAGFDTYVPLSPATIDDWTGTGWMQVRDDGAFGFLLAGATAGGSTTQALSRETQVLYDAGVDGALGALGQSSNVTVAKGAAIASTVLAPIGAGIETYETIKEVQEDGGSTLEAVGAGVAAGTVRGFIGIATGILAAEAFVAGGPPGFVITATAGNEFADRATEAVRQAVVDALP